MFLTKNQQIYKINKRKKWKPSSYLDQRRIDAQLCCYKINKLYNNQQLIKLMVGNNNILDFV